MCLYFVFLPVGWWQSKISSALESRCLDKRSLKTENCRLKERHTGKECENLLVNWGHRPIACICLFLVELLGIVIRGTVYTPCSVLWIMYMMKAFCNNNYYSTGILRKTWERCKEDRHIPPYTCDKHFAKWPSPGLNSGPVATQSNTKPTVPQTWKSIQICKL